MLKLTTQHLSLCPFSEPDTEGLLTLFHDEAVRKYLWDDVLVQRDVVSDVISVSSADFEAGYCGMFAIRAADIARIIGFCGLRKAEFAAPAFELLYGLLPNFWGRGLAVEAATCVLSQAVNECSIRQIVAATDTPNSRSVKVMERLGLQFENRRLYSGLDTLFYSLPQHVLDARYHRNDV